MDIILNKLLDFLVENRTFATAKRTRSLIG